MVVWRRLTGDLVEEGADATDKRAQQRFLQRVTSLKRHLDMTFGRFLLRENKPLQINLNEVPVVGWDPFLADHPTTQRLSSERLLLRGETVEVSPFVLPHRSKLTDAEYECAGGQDGWNAQQGFYVYRADRLIQAGGWFIKGHTKDADHNLARIAVDVPATLDRDWSLDVRKAFVRPPGPLADDLKRIASVTRGKALEVYRHRGTHVRRRIDKPAEPVWQQFKKHGTMTFRINGKHPLIAELLENSGAGRRALLDLIRVIEETLPVPLLPGGRAEESRPPFDAEADKEIERVAERVYERLLREGLTRHAARDRLLKIEPFNLYPDLVDQICGSA